MSAFSNRPGRGGLAALAAAAVLLGGALGAQADVRYTSEMQIGDAAKGGAQAGGAPASAARPAIRTTTFVKDNRERVESSIQAGPVKLNTVTLTLCDKQQAIKMDPALKLYTVSPIGGFSPGVPMTGRRGMTSPSEPMPEGKPGTGKVVTTFGVQDLGAEKVAGQDAHHYLLTIRSQQSGCIGDSDTNMKLETWVAPIKGGLNCPERFAPSRVVPNERGCQITYETKGDVDALRAIFGGMVVRQKIYTMDKNGDKGGTLVATQELRDYSTATLDASLFAPPDDFKQVSEQDYQQAERQAMMKLFLHGGEGTPKTDDSKDDGKAPGDDGTPSSDDQNKDDGKKKEHGGFKVPGLPFP